MGAITATHGSQQKAFSQEWKKGFFIAAGQAVLQAEVRRGSGRGYRRNDIMFQWESQKCSLQSETLAPSPSHSCMML